FDVAFSYEDAVKHMDEVEEVIFKDEDDEQVEKPVSWLWIIIIMIFGESGVKMYKDYLKKRKESGKKDS
nr:hypothetical protein [Lachnospiraceae bacterium]